MNTFFSANRQRWFGGVAVLVIAVVVMMFSLGGSAQAAEAESHSHTFAMVPSSPAIQACLPKAAATVKIVNVKNGQKMTIKVTGLAPKTGYDLFVTQVPHAKFGISWYQSDLQTDSHGNGSATVIGIFSRETFSISPDSLTTIGRDGSPQTGATFNAVNQYHLGLWFNDPQVPFNLNCEPGKSAPVVTPFNGEQNAGIQVLNTSNFDDNNGPLKQF